MSADSLQYLVLDEFHTYDGAQGTDVAMLLRRLGPHAEELLDRRRRASPRRTGPGRSAGSPRSPPRPRWATRAAPTAMLDFAHTVFGEVSPPTAVIEETRLTPDEWRRRGSASRDAEWRPVEPGLPTRSNRITDAAARRRRQPGHRRRGIRRTLREARMTRRSQRLTCVELVDPEARQTLLERAHASQRTGSSQAVLESSVDAVSLADLADRVVPGRRRRP